MTKQSKYTSNHNGFTVVEILIAIAIFAIMVTGIISAYNVIQQSYNASKRLNEIYTVLSACPEIDRALEFSSLESGTNCYPNNTFKAEGGATNSVSYSPILTVTDTASLPGTDPLQPVPDSKVIEVETGYALGEGSGQYKLRLLITRNGVAQQ